MLCSSSQGQVTQTARRLKTKPFYSRKYLWWSPIHSHVIFRLQLPQLPNAILWFPIPDTQMMTPDLFPPTTLNVCQYKWCLLPLSTIHFLLHVASLLKLFILFSHQHLHFSQHFLTSISPAEPCSTQRGRHSLCSNTFLLRSMSRPMNELLL